jgi:hypothetical protein
MARFRDGVSAIGREEEIVEGCGRVGQIGIVAAVGAVEEERRSAEALELFVESQDALRRHDIVPPAGRERNRHRQGVCLKLGRTLPVFLRHLLLRPSVARRDRVEESSVFDEVRRAVERADAVDEIGMERGERQGPRAPHRAATDEHPFDPVPLPRFGDDLHDIGLRLRAHPRRRCPVIGGEENRPVPGRRLACAAAFVAGLPDELPAVGAVAMEGDQEIVRQRGIEVGGEEFDE